LPHVLLHVRALLGLMASYEAARCCSDHAVMAGIVASDTPPTTAPFRQPLAEAGVTSTDSSKTDNANAVLISIPIYKVMTQ
jgi:hypothetical protein